MKKVWTDRTTAGQLHTPTYAAVNFVFVRKHFIASRDGDWLKAGREGAPPHRRPPPDSGFRGDKDHGSRGDCEGCVAAAVPCHAVPYSVSSPMAWIISFGASSRWVYTSMISSRAFRLISSSLLFEVQVFVSHMSAQIMS